MSENKGVQIPVDMQIKWATSEEAINSFKCFLNSIAEIAGCLPSYCIPIHEANKHILKKVSDAFEAPDTSRIKELNESIIYAINCLIDHIDKYHDCCIPENTESYTELKELRNIMHHLMGTVTNNSKCMNCGEEIPFGDLCIMCDEEKAEWRGARG